MHEGRPNASCNSKPRLNILVSPKSPLFVGVEQPTGGCQVVLCSESGSVTLVFEVDVTQAKGNSFMCACGAWYKYQTSSWLPLITQWVPDIKPLLVIGELGTIEAAVRFQWLVQG